jgi:hypothetical protein
MTATIRLASCLSLFSSIFFCLWLDSILTLALILLFSTHCIGDIGIFHGAWWHINLYALNRQCGCGQRSNTLNYEPQNWWRHGQVFVAFLRLSAWRYAQSIISSIEMPSTSRQYATCPHFIYPYSLPTIFRQKSWSLIHGEQLKAQRVQFPNWSPWTLIVTFESDNNSTFCVIISSLTHYRVGHTVSILKLGVRVVRFTGTPAPVSICRFHLISSANSLPSLRRRSDHISVPAIFQSMGDWRMKWWVTALTQNCCLRSPQNLWAFEKPQTFWSSRAWTSFVNLFLMGWLLFWVHSNRIALANVSPQLRWSECSSHCLWLDWIMRWNDTFWIHVNSKQIHMPLPILSSYICFRSHRSLFGSVYQWPLSWTRIGTVGINTFQETFVFVVDRKRDNCSSIFAHFLCARVCLQDSIGPPITDSFVGSNVENGDFEWL